MARQNGLPAIHPGEFLSEILEEEGLSQSAFAHAIGVSAMRISHIINGSRPVTAELAILFSHVFEQTPEYWMNLQMDYDLKIATPLVASKVSHIQPFTA